MFCNWKQRQERWFWALKVQFDHIYVRIICMEHGKDQNAWDHPQSKQNSDFTLTMTSKVAQHVYTSYQNGSWIFLQTIAPFFFYLPKKSKEEVHIRVEKCMELFAQFRDILPKQAPYIISLAPQILMAVVHVPWTLGCLVTCLVFSFSTFLPNAFRSLVAWWSTSSGVIFFTHITRSFLFSVHSQQEMI